MHILQTLIQVPVYLIWHQNERVYFSFKKERDLLILRLHILFYDAPPFVLEAIAEYVRTKSSRAKAVFKKMAHEFMSQRVLKPKELPSKGKTYDLEAILSAQQKDFSLDLKIGWGKGLKKRRHRCITFGSFDPARGQIRIHPLLDDPRVPLYFVEYVVYHEMLHALYPPKMGPQGRCIIHGKEFREKEREFTFFKEAKTWEKEEFQSFQNIRRGMHGGT